MAPNLSEKMWLYRPILADPPLCGFPDLKRMTIDDVADMHELLDLRDAVTHAESERQSRAQRPGAMGR